MPNPTKTADYGGLPASLTEGPAGMSNRCDNFRRINGPDSPLSQCPASAKFRIVFLNGDQAKTVKRCPVCARRLQVSRNLIKCEVL